MALKKDMQHRVLYYQPKQPMTLKLQRKCDFDHHVSAGDRCDRPQKRRLQRKRSNHSGGTVAPTLVHDVLRSPGRQLDPTPRAFMEHSFGYDFSRVRIHTDAQAARSARAVSALAYTVGQTVVFGSGQYAPGSPEGQRLLAHELAHVVQQSQAPSDSAELISSPKDAGETAADKVAQQVAVGEVVDAAFANHAALPVLQRDVDPDGLDMTLRPSLWFLLSAGSLTIDGFPLNEAVLTTEQVQSNERHAETLLRLLEIDPNGRIEITGHTDATGSEIQNQRLGRQRAEAVRNVLAAANIPANRIGVVSAGETEFRVDTPRAEPLNRRAEIFFLPSLRLPVRRPSPAVLDPNTPPLTLNPKPVPAPTPGGATRPNITPSICNTMPELCRLPQGPDRRTLPPDFWRKLPSPPRTRVGLRNFLERDPLLRLLPDFLRERALSALDRTDEEAVEAVIGQIEGLDSTTQQAVTALLQALLRYMKGERWEPPLAPPPSRLPPEVREPGQTYQAPGERIFTLPPIKF